MFDQVCEYICQGLSLREIAAKEGMPSPWQILRFVSKSPEAAQQYAYAKEWQSELLADEIIEIADDARNDWMEVYGDDGEAIGWKLNGEHTRRSQMRIDARKWRAAKLRPKVYGDKGELEVTMKMIEAVMASKPTEELQVYVGIDPKAE